MSIFDNIHFSQIIMVYTLRLFKFSFHFQPLLYLFLSRWSFHVVLNQRKINALWFHIFVEHQLLHNIAHRHEMDVALQNYNAWAAQCLRTCVHYYLCCRHDINVRTCIYMNMTIFLYIIELQQTNCHLAEGRLLQS